MATDHRGRRAKRLPASISMISSAWGPFPTASVVEFDRSVIVHPAGQYPGTLNITVMPVFGSYPQLRDGWWSPTTQGGLAFDAKA